MFEKISSSNVIVSLNEAYKRSKACGLGVSKKQIKLWADDGKINANRYGKKYIIYWNSLIDYIRTMRINPADNTTAPQSNGKFKSLDEYNNSVSRRNAQIAMNNMKKRMKDK